jgi:cytochrome d ubiquinol oxidase subunit I
VMSFLACNNFSCKVTGVNELQAEYVQKFGPGDYVPLMVFTYWGFRIMMAFGFVTLGISALALLMVMKGWPDKLTKWLKWMPWTIAMPFIAGIAGWITTEMGRQPWVVQGLLTTRQAISPNLTSSDVLISLIGFTTLYATFTGVTFMLMRRFALLGSDAALSKSVPAAETQLRLVGAAD